MFFYGLIADDIKIYNTKPWVITNETKMCMKEKETQRVEKQPVYLIKSKGKSTGVRIETK